MHTLFSTRGIFQNPKWPPTPCNDMKIKISGLVLGLHIMLIVTFNSRLSGCQVKRHFINSEAEPCIPFIE